WIRACWSRRASRAAISQVSLARPSPWCSHTSSTRASTPWLSLRATSGRQHATANSLSLRSPARSPSCASISRGQVEASHSRVRSTGASVIERFAGGPFYHPGVFGVRRFSGAWVVLVLRVTKDNQSAAHCGRTPKGAPSLFDAVQVLRPAQEQLLAHHGGGGV